MARIHRDYALLVNKRYRWQGHLWQEWFYSTVMDDVYTCSALRYVELNPVRAKLCQSPDQWKWSSARAHLTGQSDDVIDVVSTKHLVSNWHEYLGETSASEKDIDIRKYTRTGRPVGCEKFLETMEALTGCDLTPSVVPR